MGKDAGKQGDDVDGCYEGEKCGDGCWETGYVRGAGVGNQKGSGGSRMIILVKLL